MLKECAEGKAKLCSQVAAISAPGASSDLDVFAADSDGDLLPLKYEPEAICFGSSGNSIDQLAKEHNWAAPESEMIEGNKDHGGSDARGQRWEQAINLRQECGAPDWSQT